MADAKISALPAASTPLAGTEVLPIVQSGVTDKVAVSDLTAGRAVSAASLTLTTTPLAATSGGTGSSAAFTNTGVVYASSTSALATGSTLTFDGTDFANTNKISAGRFVPTGSTVPSNGMYLSAANTLGWATNSTLRLTLNSTGQMGLGTIPSTVLNVYDASSAVFLLQGDATTSAIVSAYISGAQAGSVSMRKYRGTRASPSAVVSGDSLGTLFFSAYGGTTVRNLSQIVCEVDTFTSDSNISSNMRFLVSPAGSAAGAEVARFDPAGNFGIGNTAPKNKLDVTGSMGLGAPVTKVADFTVAATENWLINNKSGSTCTVTLPSAASSSGRIIRIQNYQTQTVVSASSNVVPLGGGAAATAILAATAGKWATLVSDATNWIIMEGN